MRREGQATFALTIDSAPSWVDARSERTAKWNRLLRLEAEHPAAAFAGREALAPRGR